MQENMQASGSGIALLGVLADLQPGQDDADAMGDEAGLGSKKLKIRARLNGVVLSDRKGTGSGKEDCGTYFPEVKKHPDKYLQRCPESVKKWLKQLKSAGKILLLITSSHSDYCRLLCEHIIGNDFEEYFDIVITNALKPGFFSHTPNQRPFRTLENDEEQEALLSLDKPGWYSQGNAIQLYELLKKMTGKLDPKVVYFGDSMHSDIFPARHYSNWETVFILEELLGDKVTVPEETELEPLEKKGKYEVRVPCRCFLEQKK
ncbi:5'-nucleotidase domain-containing protein 1-like, partial [Antrostomus carolinensis]|uniref:5'-nucleotidase domain-containing protein 1-like n=1 Tax=Antrostomus carolinensis TaxID=279965 RepID=UPI0010A98883